MAKVAIVCQAYGTDPSGKLTSDMNNDVIRRAIQLVNGLHTVDTVYFQGGYSANGGPKEATLMMNSFRKLYPGAGVNLVKEDLSLNSLQGARNILQLAIRDDVTSLYVIGEDFHLDRLRLTYNLVFRGSGIRLDYKGVSTPFGRNSQQRLQSSWRWWPWEIAARVLTPILYFLGK